jgi:hypothetical protein
MGQPELLPDHGSIDEPAAHCSRAFRRASRRAATFRASRAAYASGFNRRARASLHALFPHTSRRLEIGVPHSEHSRGGCASRYIARRAAFDRSTASGFCCRQTLVAVTQQDRHQLENPDLVFGSRVNRAAGKMRRQRGHHLPLASTSASAHRST